MSFLRYPEYKDSGVEWLGQVPAHWGVPRLRFAAHLNPSKSEVRQLPPETLVSFLPMEAIGEDGSIDLGRQRMLADVTEGYTYVRDGDVVLAKITPCFENGKGAVLRGLENGIGFGTTELIVVRSDEQKLSPSFLYYLFTSPAFRQAGESWMYGAGGQKRVPDSFVRDAVIPLPSAEEQGEISAFLDRETAKIDALVAEQERLIALLKEKRLAVISHAVTRGLNPDAPMKESGIEFIGQIPAYWTLAPLSSKYSVQLGKMLDTSKVTGRNLRHYLRVADVQWGFINTDDLPQMDFDDLSREKFRLESGDLLVNEGGSYPGRAALWEGQIDNCYYQKALHRVRVIDSKRDSSRFLLYIMEWAAHLGVFSAGGNEATIEHLPADKLRRYRFAFPELDEQRRITDYLDAVCASLDHLSSDALRAIDLMKEHRSALITAAVTGQIDVRGLTPAEAA